jgi:transposase-like protein
VIVTAVRWACRFRLSLADVRDLLAERGIEVSPRSILSRVQQFGPPLAATVRRAARPVGRRWSCDETSVRVAGRWAYLCRAVDGHGQGVDVLLRARRDLASARACFAHAIRRRRVRRAHVVTDKHQPSVRAIRRHARRAGHTRTGLHRARGATTKAIERSHVPSKDRLRPRRGLQSVPSGQRLPEGLEVIQAIRRGDLGARPATPPRAEGGAVGVQ